MKKLVFIISLLLLGRLSFSQNDSLVLVKFYNDLDGPNWLNHSGWLEPNIPVSNWFGVTVRDGRVVQLSLVSNLLSGTLPVEIGLLSELEDLAITSNPNLTGAIPVELGNLRKLKSLNFTLNNLTGTIPSEICNVKSLKVLSFNNNQLSGNIPPCLGELTNLEALGLDNNLFTGEIPEELGYLPNLQILSISSNLLSGNIPATFGNLSNLKSLGLQNSKLYGIIPSELCNIPSLELFAITGNNFDYRSCPVVKCLMDKGTKLDNANAIQQNGFFLGSCAQSGLPCNITDSLALVALYNSSDGNNWFNKSGWLEPERPVFTWNGVTLNNGRVVKLYLEAKNLNGTLAPELGNLSMLSELSIMANKTLSGSIPENLKNLSNLSILNLSDNGLTGSIPDWIDQLSKLTYLKLNFNMFSGIIPSQIVNLPELSELYLEGNDLEGEIPYDIGRLTKLSNLFLSDNILSGQIPISIGTCERLYYLQVNGNNLSGVIPASLCDLPLHYANFEGNLFDSQSCVTVECLLKKGMTFTPPDQIQQTGFSLENGCEFVKPNLREQDSLILVNFYHNTHGDNWFRKDGWLQDGIPMERWFGIVVQNNRVISIDLPGNNLNGPIPDDFYKLNYLVGIYMPGNNLTGEIKPEIGNLFDLRVFALNGNPLGGQIPKELGKCINLGFLRLGGCKLYGPIPYELTNLTNLGKVFLDDNQLDGNPLNIFCKLKNLSYLVLQKNKFAGEIPPEDISNLTKLEVIELSDNQFYGSLPIELFQLPLLGYLMAKNNSFSGPLPVNGQYTSTLGIVWLQGNKLSGTLPDEIYHQPNLTWFEIQDNQFEGEISPLISQMKSLGTFVTSNNKLSGKIPTEICLTNVNIVDFSSNNFDSRSCPAINGLKNKGVRFLSPGQVQLNGFSLLTGCISDPVLQQDSLALVAFYHSTNGPNWTNHTGWLEPGVPVSQWLGIVVENRRVVDIHIDNNNLSGSFPPEFCDLTGLRRIMFNFHNITGPIPTCIGNLTELQFLNIHGNKMEGEIPPGIVNCSNLYALHIGSNNFSGVLPVGICNLPITEFNFVGNRFDSQSCPTVKCLVEKGAFYGWSPQQEQQSGFSLINDCDDKIPFILAEYSLNGNALDGSGNGYDGTINGAAPSSDHCGMTNGAFHFDRTDDYLEMPSTCLRNLSKGSIEVILKIDQLNSDHWFFCYGLDAGSGISMCIDASGALCYMLNGEAGEVTRGNSGKIFIGKWYHIVLTWDGSSVRTYINGELDMEWNRADYPGSVDDNLLIGADTFLRPQYMFPGVIDFVRIYQGALNTVEIQTLFLEFNNCPSNDRNALVALYNATCGPEWTNHTNWLTSEPISNWFGVTVENNRVSKIELPENNLNGFLPTAIGNLSGLKTLILDNNKIGGQIPLELGQLSSLTFLSLRFNQLSGSIPVEIGLLINLNELYLDKNQLTGEIPIQISQLKNLGILFLAANQLTGSIPEELALLTNLSELWLGENQLNGNIPNELGSLVHLRNLIIYGNQLSGNIPVELGNLVELIDLNLGRNQLTGNIPSELGNFQKLQAIHLDSNHLTGEIPTSFGGISSLKRVDFHTNDFFGAIPIKLCQIDLDFITLYGNDFNSESCPTIRCLQAKGVEFPGDPTQTQKSGFSLINDCQCTTPKIERLSGPAEPVAVDALVTMNAVISGIGVESAGWDWGDGTTSFSDVNNEIATTHIYNSPGVYIPKLTLTGCGETVSSTFMYVVIFDPAGGYVTGLGSINSPAGASILYPEATGKANFGFVSKYKKGATTPSGTTIFKFKAGNLDFNSSSFDWLVISGSKATFKGWGTINDTGDYGFLISSSDGDLKANVEPDKFRIKIWERSSENLVYDNQAGADITQDPTTAITSGSIVIHDPKAKAAEISIETGSFTNLLIYPNPVKDILKIQGLVAGTTNEIHLLDLTGRVVRLKKTQSGDAEIPMTSLASGMYHLIINSGESVFKTKIAKN